MITYSDVSGYAEMIEEVVRGALGDTPGKVEHHRLGHAGFLGLDLGQDVVEVVERLDTGIETLDRDAPRAGRDQRDAVLVELRWIELDRGTDDDERGLGATRRVNAQVADAAGDEETQSIVVLFE